MKTASLCINPLQECLTYDGEMDYKTYLDFVLAIENRKEPAALQYLFKLLDVQNRGYLNVFALNYFFRGIQVYFLIRSQIIPCLFFVNTFLQDVLL